MPSGDDQPFPFVPKSNAFLLPGHFWPIPLRDGRFAAGVVLNVPSRMVRSDFAGSRRMVVIGLLDWSGPSMPDVRALNGVTLRECGDAHVRSIVLTSGGRGIIGRLDAMPTELSYLSHGGGPGVWVMVNGQPDHPASAEERVKLEVWETWGLIVIEGLANKHFGTRQPSSTPDPT